MILVVLRALESEGWGRGGDSGPFLHMDMGDFIRLYHNDIMHSGFLLHDTNISIRLLLQL